MQSRRDQVQAYSFVVGRLTSSMLSADPDAVDTHLGRTKRGTVIGLVIGLLLCVGCALSGLLLPGTSTAWRRADAIIVEKETGARYLYGGGELRPVLNYASAKLAAGEKGLVQEVSRDSLDGVPRGTPIGIPDAPDSLPAGDALSQGTWQVCATSRNGDDDGDLATTSVGIGVSAGSPPLPDGKAVLVQDARENAYLLWHGQRLRLDGRSGAVQALGYGTTDPVSVDESFLAAVPAGPDLSAPDVAGRGSAGPVIAGHQRLVGQFFVVRTPSSADQYYLLTKAGLVPFTLTGTQLLRGDAATRSKAYGGAAPTAVELTPDQVKSALAKGKQPDMAAGLPAAPPRAVTVGGAVPCLTVAPHSGAPRQQITLTDRKLAGGRQIVPRQSTAPGCPQPGLVTAQPGTAVLARPVPGRGGDGSGAGAGAPYLVTGDGTKYPLAHDSVLKKLSYTEQEAVRLPSALLRLLPTGPVLDPSAAARPALAAPQAPQDPECRASGSTTAGSGKGTKAAG
ncbi:type VII secretion protein EccB [Streptomyces tubercidicus]|uniref:type VII secretion protein EccB n=1 Tax=Streptomyces tubercidicus TaxID=47759 RepID=UPI0037A18798